MLFSGRNTTQPGDSEQAGFLLLPALNNHICPVLEYACSLLLLGKNLRILYLLCIFTSCKPSVFAEFPHFPKATGYQPFPTLFSPLISAPCLYCGLFLVVPADFRPLPKPDFLLFCITVLNRQRSPREEVLNRL